MKRIAGQQVNLRYCIRCYYILVVCTITCKCCTEFTTKFGTDMGTISIAVSLTALFSGMFVVGAGGLADKIGRVKMTNIGLLLSIIGSAFNYYYEFTGIINFRSCYTRCISSVYYAFYIGHYENLLSGC